MTARVIRLHAVPPVVDDEIEVTEDADLVEELVDVLDADETPEPSALEQKLAAGLAFLRRRITGDFEVDDFGYDPELTEHRAARRDAPALPALVPRRGPRHREHPQRGRRADRRQPLRHGRRSMP